MLTGRTISIYIDEDLLSWIDIEARRDGRNRNNYLIKILEDLRNGKLVKEETDKERRTIEPPVLRRAY